VVNFLFKETAKEKNVVKKGIKYEKISQQTSTNDFISSNYDTNWMRYSTGVSKSI
jgi:predicted nucleotidyltransferase component of viral defense system